MTWPTRRDGDGAQGQGEGGGARYLTSATPPWPPTQPPVSAPRAVDEAAGPFGVVRYTCRLEAHGEAYQMRYIRSTEYQRLAQQSLRPCFQTRRSRTKRRKRTRGFQIPPQLLT